MDNHAWHITYLKIAGLISEHSKAIDKKVGAILVKDNRIISIGYNGTLPGFNNVCENPDGSPKDEVIHAEVNCLAKCARSTESACGATMYITLSPCVRCATIAIQSGVSHIYYNRISNKSKDAFGLLEEAGIIHGFIDTL